MNRRVTPDNDEPTGGTGRSFRPTRVNTPPDGTYRLVQFMPAIEVPRREGESILAAARRFTDIQLGCYGD